MPILGIIKVMHPKTVVRKATLSPAAIIPLLISPIASSASKAAIIPIVEPKKPNTKPKMLTSEAKRVIFLDLSTSLLRLSKPITTKNSASNKQIKIKDIKKGPPSLNLSTKGFETTTGKKFIINGFS